MADATLYLTQEEIDNIFLKLPAEKQKTWKPMLTVETGKAFESASALQKRMDSVQMQDIPGMKEFCDTFTKTIAEGDLTKASVRDVPQVALLRHFYSIGACGMSALMEIVLQDPKLDDQALEAVADFSVIRHAILEANAAA